MGWDPPWDPGAGFVLARLMCPNPWGVAQAPVAHPTVQSLCHTWPSASGVALPPWHCPGTAEWIFLFYLYYILIHLYSPTASSFHLYIFSLVNLGFL